nr:DUF3592 domain-containing protein [uncultured Sphingomonas sp.]
MSSVLLLVGRDDWSRLRGQRRRVLAQVVRHATFIDDSGRRYTPIYRFADDRGEAHEVQDELYSGAPSPDVGTMVELSYPSSRPDLARLSRPGIRILVYGTLVAILSVLVGLLAGWIAR